MAEAIIIEFPCDEDRYFGVCPKCGRTDGYVNVERHHWFYCSRHKLKWRVGSNLFSGWQDETEEDWACAEEMLSSYVEVEPLYGPQPADEQRRYEPVPGGDDIPF